MPAYLTSLNVVSIAAVDCDCTIRSAIRKRSLDIGTRCSDRLPPSGNAELPESLDDVLDVDLGCTCSAIRLPLIMRPPRPLYR